MGIEWKSTGHVGGQGPLCGLRIVELTHVLAGPICGLMLADMGAEVIKVERPPAGDGQRWDVASEDTVGPYSASFSTLNRNKRSVVLDLKTVEDREILLELLGSADALVHNYRGGVLERLGLGYEEISKRFPSLIYCTISGFGTTGPWASRGGFDLVAQAMSGVMTFTGPEYGSEPIKCGVPLTDIAGGVLLAMGMLAALHRRSQTGLGDHVDTSLLEAGVMFTFLQSAVSLATGNVPKPMGSAHPLYSPYETYKAEGGWIALGTANEANWKRLVEILGRPELATDERFSTTPKRVENRTDLTAELSACLIAKTRDAWVEELSAAGIPCGPVLNVPEMLSHPQVLAREMIVEVEHEAFGSYRAIGCPIKFRNAGLAKPRAAPLLNEH